MTLAALKASLSLWKRRYGSRKLLLAKAQQELLEARAANVHPRQQFIDKVELREKQLKEAEDLIKKREGQVAKAEGAKSKVRRPFERVKINVRNQSSRNGVKPKIIVLHTTEGANVPNSVTDLTSLGNWFNNPSAQASSHVGVDADGYCAKFVDDADKSWACAAYNSLALNIEQVGFASQKTFTEAELNATAKYIAYWSKKYGIPITHSISNGVCQHSDLGSAGGGHNDCGPNYPFDRVLEKARAYAKNGW